MDTNKSERADSGEAFIRAILLLGGLGAAWLTVMIAYAMWIGLVG
jgi:hypothetical protein